MRQRRANRHASEWPFAELHGPLAYTAALAGSRCINRDANLDVFQTGWSEPEWQQAITGLGEAQGVKPGAVFMLLRVAVTGTDQTPPFYPLVRLPGEVEARRRLETALMALA